MNAYAHFALERSEKDATASIEAIFTGLPDVIALRCLYSLVDRFSGSMFSDGVVKSIEILADDLAEECGFESGEHLLKI